MTLSNTKIINFILSVSLIVVPLSLASFPNKVKADTCSTFTTTVDGTETCLLNPPDPAVFCAGKCPAAYSCKTEVTTSNCGGGCGGGKESLKTRYCCKCFAAKNADNTRPPAPRVPLITCHGDFLLGGSYGGVDSGLGCLPTDFRDLAAWVLSIALGIGGALAVGLIIMSGYKIMTSQGDPDKLEEGKGTLTAAISGLLFIVFSVTIYRLIATNLLNI